MTEFQDYCKKNPRCIIRNAWDKFKEFYPKLTGREAREKFNQEISEIFFVGPPQKRRRRSRK